MSSYSSLLWKTNSVKRPINIVIHLPYEEKIPIYLFFEWQMDNNINWPFVWFSQIHLSAACSEKQFARNCLYCLRQNNWFVFCLVNFANQKRKKTDPLTCYTAQCRAARYDRTAREAFRRRRTPSAPTSACNRTTSAPPTDWSSWSGSSDWRRSAAITSVWCARSAHRSHSLPVGPVCCSCWADHRRVVLRPDCHRSLLETKETHKIKLCYENRNLFILGRRRCKNVTNNNYNSHIAPFHIRNPE